MAPVAENDAFDVAGPHRKHALSELTDMTLATLLRAPEFT